MLGKPETIVDDEIRALCEPLPTPPAIGRGRRRQRLEWRQYAAQLLLSHPPRFTRLAQTLQGSLAENLRGFPPTTALQKHIVKQLLALFWTILPEEDNQWLRAYHTAHNIAEAVVHELAPPQIEEMDPSSLKDEIH